MSYIRLSVSALTERGAGRKKNSPQAEISPFREAEMTPFGDDKTSSWGSAGQRLAGVTAMSPLGEAETLPLRNSSNRRNLSFLSSFLRNLCLRHTSAFRRNIKTDNQIHIFLNLNHFFNLNQTFLL